MSAFTWYFASDPRGASGLQSLGLYVNQGCAVINGLGPSHPDTSPVVELFQPGDGWPGHGPLTPVDLSAHEGRFASLELPGVTRHRDQDMSASRGLYGRGEAFDAWILPAFSPDDISEEPPFLQVPEDHPGLFTPRVLAAVAALRSARPLSVQRPEQSAIRPFSALLER